MKAHRLAIFKNNGLVVLVVGFRTIAAQNYYFAHERSGLSVASSNFSRP